MGDHTIGNNQETQGRDTSKAKADIRLKVLLKSIWQRLAACSQNLPSKLLERGRASKGPAGTAGLRASARAVPKDILTSSSVQHHCLPHSTTFGQEQPPPFPHTPPGCSRQRFPSQRLHTSQRALCGSTSRVPRHSSADKPGRFYAWLVTEIPYCC